MPKCTSYVCTVQILNIFLLYVSSVSMLAISRSFYVNILCKLVTLLFDAPLFDKDTVQILTVRASRINVQPSFTVIHLYTVRRVPLLYMDVLYFCTPAVIVPVCEPYTDELYAALVPLWAEPSETDVAIRRCTVRRGCLCVQLRLIIVLSHAVRSI